MVLPDDLLPGVGAESLPMRETFRRGGWSTIVMVVLIVIVEKFSRQAVAVLGPDLQDTFHINDTKLNGLAAGYGIALVLGAVPLAWLADRYSRKRLAVLSGYAGAVALLATALVANPFQLFWAFAAIGITTAYINPAFGSLLADQYPIEGRARIFALYAMADPLGLVIGPFIAGGIASLAGGTEGWRWVYIVIAVPVALLAVAAGRFLREPRRGRFEQEFVFGEQLSSIRPELPITISTAYQRLKKIKTFYFICIGIGVLGFAFITVPVQFGLLLKDEYGYNAFTRGWLLSAVQVPSVIAILAAGYAFDRIYRHRPERVVHIAGAFILAFGVVLVSGVWFQSIVALMAFYALASACSGAALVSIGPIVSSVAPYRLRSQAFAIMPVFLFLMGGFLGGLLAGALSDAEGERTALTIVVPLSSLVGGGLFLYGSRYLKRDISLAVEELLEEQAEQRRMSARPDEIPVLQVRNLDFSYGQIQVLFDIDLEVHRGEVLALLGTNGAGKSTLLRAISGLGIPDRGVIRLNGQALTYVEAEVRSAMGVVQLRGGAGVFPELSIVENLRTVLLARKLPEAEQAQLVDRAFDLFPALAASRERDARQLSGGEQQMLAMAMTLIQDPEVLLIDELSLGLAPHVIEQLLHVVERLKAEGRTIIIVEQSLNLALAVSDRAVFMEKGRIRFEGPAEELLDHGDLVRAVFLGDPEDGS